jgi:mono/diheme cytochrome c family protein
MKPLMTLATFIAAGLIGIPDASWAQAKTDLGKREYDNNCAVCHGLKGKGDGPYAGDLLKTRVPDLAVLTKQNQGVFPVARMYEIIDGRQQIKGHGTRDMPIWGYDYTLRAAEYYRDVDYNPEYYVRARILALIEYVHRLQEK